MAPNRGLGFSVEFKKADELQKKFETLTAKALEFGKAVKELKSTPLTFDVKGLTDFSKVLSQFSKTNIDPNVSKQIKDLQSEITSLKKQLTEANAQIENFKAPKLSTAEVDDFNQTMKEVGMTTQQVEKHLHDLAPALKLMNTPEADKLFLKITDIKNAIQSITATKKVVSLAIEDPTARTKAIAELEKQERALKSQLVEVNKESKIYIQTQEAIANSTPKDSINGLYLQLKTLTQQYKNLTQEELNSARGKELKNSINEKKAVINSANEAIGNFQHNVGNYISGIRGLIPELENAKRAGLITSASLNDFIKADLLRQADNLEIEIKQIEQELKDIGPAADKAGERMAKFATLNGKLGDLGKIKTELAGADQGVNKMGGSLLRVSDIITGGLIGGGILGLISGVKSFGASSIQEFTQAETALAKIKQQLIATDHASGKTAEGLRDTAKELMVITGIDDDQILNDTTSTLISFTSLQGEVFDRTQKAAIDLAATMKGDLKAAALLAGKAAEEPEKAAERLAKAGVILSKQTKEAIQDAVKHGDVEKARIIVLDALEGKFKGVSDAIQNSALKNARSFSVFYQNLKESAGALFLGIFNELATEFKRFGEDATAGTKETKAAISQLNVELGKEEDSIHATFKALKEKNLEDGVKKKLIEDLVRKYPQYLSKLDLEQKSNEDLTILEEKLTETVKKATFTRILARTKEALSAAEDAERIRLASLKSGSNDELGLYDKIRLKVGESLGKSAEDQKTAAENLRAQEIADGDKRLQLKIQQNQKIEEELKKSLEKEFGIIIEANVIKDKAGGSGSPIVTPEALKELEAQLKRIEEIRRQNADKTADLIANEFDKKVQQAKLRAQNSLADLQAEANKLKEGGITGTDQKQLDQIEKQSELIRAGLQKEIGTIEQERVTAITNFKQSLIDSRSELLSIITESNVKLSQGKIDTELFNQDKKLSLLQQSYEKDKLNLEIALRDKQITQEEFDQQSLILTGTYSANVEKEVLRSNAILKNLYQKQFKDKKLAIEQAAKISIAQAEKDGLSQAGQIDPNLDSAQKAILEIEIFQKTVAKKKEIKDDADAEILRSSQDLQKKIIDLKDKEISAHEATEKAKVAITKEQAKEIEAIILALSGVTIDIRVNLTPPDEDLIKQIKEGAIQLAGELSNALATIENNHSEANFEKRKTDITNEYDNRLKLAKGNSAETERIERERDAKLKLIEKEQAQRRKQAAIAQAIINGALAITSIFAQVPKFDFGISTFILAGIAAASTAIQIAVIKSQKFAKGGYSTKYGGYTGGSQAPPDETGERPVNATLHEGEWTGSRKHVNKHRLLYEIFNKDNARVQVGQPSNLDHAIIDYAERRKLIYGLQPKNSFRHETVIPMIIPVSQNSRPMTIKIDKENMQEFAEMVAAEVAQQTGQSVYEGSSKGISDSNKNSNREERRLQKSQV